MEKVKKLEQEGLGPCLKCVGVYVQLCHFVHVHKGKNVENECQGIEDEVLKV